MTPAKFASYVRKQTKSNTTTFPDADILLYANTFKDEMAAELVELDEDIFVMEFTRDLEADKRAYAFPSGILTRMKKAQAKLDGTDWEDLRETDINNIKGHPLVSEANIQDYFSDKQPRYDIRSGALHLYTGDAITAVTDGLKLWATLYPKDLTDLSLTTDMSVNPSATEFGIPRPIHELLARRVIIAYKSSKDKPIPLSEKEQAFEEDWARVTRQIRGGNMDRAIIPSMKRDTGHDY